MEATLERVAVVGTSCAGKTTLARRLASILDAPCVELDALYWGPDWTPSTENEFHSRVATALSLPRWVCDGNYRAVREAILARATTVVWLDYGFPRVFWGALNRSVRRSITGEPLYAGNRESLARTFLSRESILLWVAHSHHGRRRRCAERLGRADASWRLVRLRHPREATRFLEAVGARRTFDRD